MPHAGHLIISNKCRFHLNTYIGGYVVSTVGEWWPERSVREVHAKVYDPEWLRENQHLKGDMFDSAYFKRFGFEEIGCDRTYETMVFKAKKSSHKCCPYVMVSGDNKDFDSYNKPEDASAGHMKMCEKWASKGAK